MTLKTSSSSSIHSIVVVVVVGSGLHAAHDGVQRKQAAVPEGLRAHHQPRHGRVRAGEAEQQHPGQEDQVRAEHHSGALLKFTLMQQLLFLLCNLLCFVSKLYLWLHLLDIDHHCILLLFLEKTHVRTYASFSQWVHGDQTLPAVCCASVLLRRAEGSSKIQARIEQQSVRSSQPSAQFRAPTKPGSGVKMSPSPSKDNPSPEPQLDDIKRGAQVPTAHRNNTT